MMPFNSKKFEKLGIKIDENQKPPKAYIPADLSDCTKHDLWLAFSGNINLITDDNQSTKNIAPNSQRDNEIFSEVDEYISEIDFIKSAEIALSANDENDAPIVREIIKKTEPVL